MPWLFTFVAVKTNERKNDIKIEIFILICSQCMEYVYVNVRHVNQLIMVLAQVVLLNVTDFINNRKNQNYFVSFMRNDRAIR